MRKDAEETGSMVYFRVLRIFYLEELVITRKILG
jgi:hypothetical protein